MFRLAALGLSFGLVALAGCHGHHEEPEPQAYYYYPPRPYYHDHYYYNRYHGRYDHDHDDDHHWDRGGRHDYHHYEIHDDGYRAGPPSPGDRPVNRSVPRPPSRGGGGSGHRGGR